MSDYVTNIPYAYGSPEYDQFLRAQAVGPLSVGAGLVNQINPIAADEQGNVIGVRPPGIVTGGYGMIGATVPDLANRFSGTNTFGHLPGAETARNWYEEVANATQNVLPSRRLAEETGDPHIQMAENVGEALGSAAVPIPGAIGNALTRLPNLARIPAEIAIGAPTLSHVPAAMVTSPLVTAGLTAAMQPGDQPPVIPDDRIAQTIPDDRLQQQVTGQEVQPRQVPFTTTSPTTIPTTLQGQVPPIQTNLQAQDQTGVLPNYGAEGEGPWSYIKGIGYTLGGLALAWGVAKYGGHLFNPVAKMAGAFKPDSAAEANAAIAARDSGNAATPTYGTKPIEAPLPGGADNPTTRLSQATIDKTRVASAVIEGVNKGDKPTADALKNSLGTTESAAAFGDRLGAQMKSGANMFDGTQGVRWADIAKTVANDIKPETYAKLDTGMQAGAELDYRNRNNGQVKNFVNTSTPELQASYDAMQADPEAMQVRNMIQNAVRDRVQTEVRMGMRTQSDADAFLRDNPNWMPEMTSTGGIRTLDTPSTVPENKGWDRPPTDTMNAHVQAYADAHYAIQRNSFVRNFVNNVLRWQDADPTRAQIFTEARGGQGRVISFYEGGQKYTYNVNSTVLYNALKRNNVQTGMTVDIMNRMRQGFTALTTGPAAIVGGRPFAPIQAFRSMMQIPVERTAGTSAGYLDRALQSATGGKFGFRMDPTFAVQMADNMARNIGSAVNKNLAEWMENKAASAGLRKLIGDQWVDATATSLNNRYLNSRLFENIQAGISRTGGSAAVEPPMFLTGGQVKGGLRGQAKYEYINPLAGAYPEAFSGVPERVRLPGQRGAIGQYLLLRNLAKDIHSQIAEAGNAAYYQANKINPRFSADTAARLARSVIGDPSMTGSSPTMQRIGKSIPYFNPALQEFVRMGRNFRDAPVAAVLGEVGTLMTLAMASIMTAMMTKGGVNYLENQMTNNQRAADVTIFHGGDDALNNTQLSLPQRWRFVMPYVQEMISTAMGAWQAHEGDPLYDRAISTMADFFGHHIQVSTSTAARHGFESMVDFGLPPAVNAAVALAGSDIHQIPSTIIENLATGRPVTEGMLGGAPETDKIPGQMGGVSGSTYISHNDGAWRDAILGELGGSLVNAYHTFIGTPWQRISEGAEPYQAVTGMGSDVLQNFRDGMPWGNMLWGNTAKLEKYDPLAENVSNAMANIRNLGDPADTSSIGATGVGGLQSMVLNANKIPDDPKMRELYDVALNFAPTMEPLEKQRNAISMIMEQIKSGGDSAQDKRKLLNDYTRQYADLTAEMDARIRMLNANLSQRAGDRVVQIQAPINWHGTVDQFHP